MMAGQEGHRGVGQLLIQHGADVNHQETKVHALLVIGYDIIILSIKKFCILLNPDWLVSSPLRQCSWSPQHSGTVHQVWGTTGRPNQGTL